jgi:hypothetical protein
MSFSFQVHGRVAVHLPGGLVLTSIGLVLIRGMPARNAARQPDGP